MKTPLTPERHWEGYYAPFDFEMEEHLSRPFVRIVDADGAVIVTAHDLFEFDPGHAERIVECVNALEGIEDPAGFIRMQRDHIAAQHESLGKSFDRCMELESALLAIVARIQGEWDNPHLVGWGGLSTDHDEDVLNIVNFTMKGVPR